MKDDYFMEDLGMTKAEAIKEGFLTPPKPKSLKAMAHHFAAKKEQAQRQFPIHVLPPTIQEIAKHYSEYRSYPIDFILTALLTVVGSLVGNSQTIKSPNGYLNKAVIWILLVASPGINKTSPLFWVYSYLTKRQAEDYKQFKADLKAAKEQAKEDGKKSPLEDFTLSKPIISDATPEALINQLSKNEKGCTALVDEAAGLMKNFERYSKGNDKEMYLSAWSGSPIIRDTLTHGTQMVHNPFLSIIGTIQPDVVNKVLSEDGDGFFDRWLICHPDNLIKPYPNSNDVNPLVTAKYERFMKLLNELYYQEETDQLQYTPEAWQVVYKWICESTDKENNPNTSDLERGIRAKMQIYVHRFALIMQLMEYGCSGIHSDRIEVKINAANAAVAIADYFYSMAEKTRLKDANELITGYLKELYDLLPEDEEFKKVDFLARSEMLEIPERTANNILKHNIGKLWTKVKHGVYVKI